MQQNKCLTAKAATGKNHLAIGSSADCSGSFEQGNFICDHFCSCPSAHRQTGLVKNLFRINLASSHILND